MSDSITVFCDPADPDAERLFSVAPRAALFLREMFEALPKTSLQLHVPDDLREFVTTYMGERGWVVSYITGPLTKKAYVRLEAKS